MKKILCIFFSAISLCDVMASDFKPLNIRKDKIEYLSDSLGNRIIDFSYCGYRQGSAPIPDVRAAVFVSQASGDQSARIQHAIDYVSQLQPDASGFRGAVLLGEGTFEISSPLRISTSGVVLRGVSKTSTVLRKIGVDRGAAVYIEGRHDRHITDTLHLSDAYVAVGQQELRTSDVSLPEGTTFRTIVVRPSTKEWIASIGCSVFGGGLGYWGWKAGEIDVCWDRTATVLPDGKIHIDVPLTASLDTRWGSGFLLRYEWRGRISSCGVENITIESSCDGTPYSEDHCWNGIYIDAAEDCWVRMADFRNLAGSAVIIQRDAQQVTVEDCTSRHPVGEIGGWRRRTFHTLGGKTLFQRCFSEEGINDFSAGFCAPGPNAFVQCDAVGTHGYSGSCSSWATGLLFDNVNIEGGGISFRNLELEKWGAGWNTANSVLWQCSASRIDCYNAAADARCYAIGCWAYCLGDGIWMEVNNHVNPRSLFLTQLSERLGTEEAEKRCRLLLRNLDGSTSPSYPRAAEMAREALLPRLTMEQWISEAVMPAGVSTSGVKDIDDIKPIKVKEKEREPALPAVTEGRLTVGGKLLAGKFHRTPWWNGRPRYSNMEKAADAITRFVPGMEQRGGTDRIDTLISHIVERNIAVWNQNYGLWYDRRRDDHERVKRITSDVWPPFFEQSIARSGDGKAWDGLSLYDLTRLNAWYFYRLNSVAAAVPQTVFINQHFFQHNILEAGAHWVDSPWRSANNIQSWGENKGRGTQFLEPVPFTGDKRIFTADLFYDVSCKERAEIYRKYIWNVLDATASNPNIFHSVSEEYTGPQHFVEFWLQCIGEWEEKNGKKANVILNATKDVVEAVMKNEKYRNIVDVIEIEQWFYHGRKLFAPEGGKNLAPRQHLRLVKTGNPDAHDIFRTVYEMKREYPKTAVMYYAKAYDRTPWAVVFAGGSCPTLNISDASLSEALSTMSPEEPDDSGVYRMTGKGGTLLYNVSGKEILAPKGRLFFVDQKNGSVKKEKGQTNQENNVAWVR